MSVEIKVPSVGESITEGVVSRWLKKNGENVRADEPVLELETEKATTEVAAPASGKLVTTVPEGKTVTIGAVVGRIEEGEAPSAPSPTPRSPSPSRSQAGAWEPEKGGDGVNKKTTPEAAEKPASAPKESPKADTTGPAGRGEASLSPAARRLVEESGMSVEQITGMGRGGRITKEDVLSHLEGGPEKSANADLAATPVPSPGADATRLAVPDAEGTRLAARETRQRMSAIRQRIADRLVASQNATATLTTFNEADMSAVIALREEFKDRFKEKHGVGLGFMSFFVKATIEALRAHPLVNARIDGPDIVFQHYYNIGVAVSTEKGLMVPVLHDADQMSFARIEKRLAELAQKARDGKIAVADLQGGTFTITNGGVFGSLLSTPILNPPQVAILGMHAIQKRPVAIGDQVVIRPMMYLALSYDHRLIDGREAVLFLVRVKECIENPARLFLEI
jgi:2-oxoglutarate dehydrogenase E2 component (dihydrolipoamide succinyltransferase)